MPVIFCAFLILVLANNRGCVQYLLKFPSALSWSSARWVLSHDLLIITEAVIFFMLLYGLGRGILRRFSIGGFHGLAYALGLGTFSWSVFILGLGGFLSIAGLFTVGLSAALFSWPELKLRAGSWEYLRQPSFPLWKAACATILLYMAWHALILSLAPPTDWDILAYHLAIPKLYWSHGKIGEIPWLLHSHWPHLMEALYIVPIALGQETLAALLHASACAALVGMAFHAAKQHWGELGSWTAAALLAVQPIMLRFAGSAHSDGALALFHFSASLAVWHWASSGSQRWLIMGGVLSGFGACAKLHGMLLMGLLALWILYQDLNSRKKWSSALKAAGIFLLCGFILALPWYLKTWAGTGNPIWPFFPGILGGRWGAEAVAAAPPSQNPWSWLMKPEFLFQEGPQFLLVPALILAILSLSRSQSSFPSLLKFLCLPMIPYLFAASLRDSAWRYCWPFYPALAMTAGWAAAQLRNSKSRGAKGLALLALAFGLWPGVQASQNNQLFEVPGLSSMLHPEENPKSLYLEKTLQIYRFCQEVNKAFPKAKVLLFREIRGYYLDTEYMWGDPLNQGMIRYSEMHDVQALNQRLQELGITHVWINEGAALYPASPEYYSRNILDLMEGLLRSHSRPVLRDGKNTLYELEFYF